MEFQNKFYSGQGFKFLPFTFESILDGRFEEWDPAGGPLLAASRVSRVSAWYRVATSLCVRYVCDAVSDFAEANVKDDLSDFNFLFNSVAKSEARTQK